VDSIVMPASENLHTNGLMHRNKFMEIRWRKSDLKCDRT